MNGWEWRAKLLGLQLVKELYETRVLGLIARDMAEGELIEEGEKTGTFAWGFLTPEEVAARQARALWDLLDGTGSPESP